MRRLKEREHLWHAFLFNCNQLPAEVAGAIGLRRPPSILPSNLWVDTLRVLNERAGAAWPQPQSGATVAPDSKLGASHAPVNLFCISSGEFLGISRAYRSVLSDCTRGSKRRNSLASLDESIATLQKSIKQTCE